MASAMSNPKQTCSMHGGQKNSMNQKNLLKIKIEKYLKVPLLLAVFWLIAAGIMFIVSREAGLIMLVFDLIYMVIVLVIYYQKRPDIMAEMVNFSFEQSQIQKELLKDLALPYTLIDLDGRTERSGSGGPGALPAQACPGLEHHQECHQERSFRLPVQAYQAQSHDPARDYGNLMQTRVRNAHPGLLMEN